MRISRKSSQTLMISFSILLCLMSFQNCGSAVGFSTQSSSGEPDPQSTNSTNESSPAIEPTNPTASEPVAGSGDAITLPPSVPVPPSSIRCGNQIEVDGQCRDFNCSRFVALAPTELQNVPARTVEGICYTYKIADAITNSPSSLNTIRDQEVISRNHDNYALPSHHPHLMSKQILDIKLAGGRVVKIAGGANDRSPILVDNFILVGIFASPPSLANLANVYSAYGTADSAAFGSSISFRDQMIPVTRFGSGGTSTVAPLDITKDIYAHANYTLDIRAEDCGGSREMSALYLLFQ